MLESSCSSVIIKPNTGIATLFCLSDYLEYVFENRHSISLLEHAEHAGMLILNSCVSQASTKTIYKRCDACLIL